MGSKQIGQHSCCFDKQFLFYIVQNLFIAVCGLVDTRFGNHIDFDSVCVLSSYTIITFVHTWCCPISRLFPLYYLVLFSDILFTLLYNAKAYLLSEHQTNYLKFGGVFGIAVRVPFVIIGYHLNLVLFPFAIACTADFAVSRKNTEPHNTTQKAGDSVEL